MSNARGPLPPLTGDQKKAIRHAFRENGFRPAEASGLIASWDVIRERAFVRAVRQGLHAGPMDGRYLTAAPPSVEAIAASTPREWSLLDPVDRARFIKLVTVGHGRKLVKFHTGRKQVVKGLNQILSGIEHLCRDLPPLVSQTFETPAGRRLVIPPNESYRQLHVNLIAWAEQVGFGVFYWREALAAVEYSAWPRSPFHTRQWISSRALGEVLAAYFVHRKWPLRSQRRGLFPEVLKAVLGKRDANDKKLAALTQSPLNWDELSSDV